MVSWTTSGWATRRQVPAGSHRCWPGGCAMMFRVLWSWAPSGDDESQILVGKVKPVVLNLAVH